MPRSGVSSAARYAAEPSSAAKYQANRSPCDVTPSAHCISGLPAEAKVSITVTGTNYALSGFFQPVDNPPIINTVNSGQSIPEKWQPYDAVTGAPTADPPSFVSFTSCQVICTTWSGDAASAINEVTPGSSGLQYLGNGNWQFNWRRQPGRGAPPGIVRGEQLPAGQGPARYSDDPASYESE